MPEFTIIMPCFNATKTLNESIGSLLSQTVRDWELICIEDGSSDETPTLLKGWASADPRIKVMQNQGQGPSAARNLGAHHATGDILCFCDSDDLWALNKLENLHRAFKDESVDGLFGRVAFFRKRGKADTHSTVPAAPLSVPFLMGENPVCTSSNISIRRKAFLQSGGFDTSMVHNEDLEWLIRIVGSGATIKGLAQLHVWYRTNPQGLSSDLVAMSRSRQRVLATACSFGFSPDKRAEAIYFRYLARRSLRLGHYGRSALYLTMKGILQSPAGFLFPLRRGLVTALCSICAPMMPKAFRRSLFSR
ncbi:glycosyltransferase family 2 protein [Sedimentitalea sp. CY04]|uniref:Glycosyltransferase family 2 protein n=1 Tax=Parasedimentitalea denitrificans TaxID=2211118 RepID=A0ABX0W3D9_9RHOB|nr:glycosyltransferase family 2 protein [Sedimentitalea sp. CY04]NIZ60173.1 glycosyltransferase family 2 protein [Sedimentitalea sp. CY04]